MPSENPQTRVQKSGAILVIMNKPQFESLDQIANETAAALVRAAAGLAFELFNDRRFRRLAGFGKLSSTEQDRILNELSLPLLS